MATNTVNPTTPNDQPQNALLASQAQQSAGEFIQTYLRRLRAGDLGILPIIISLVAISLLFQSQNDVFLSPQNIVNLMLQMTGTTIIAFGVVFVLQLGEIDLSVGFVSGVAAVVMVMLLRPPYELSPLLAIGIALVASLVIGALHGFLITFFQLPSFIVSLAGLLAWNGVVLGLVGDGGTIRIGEPFVRDFASTYLPATTAWIIAIGAIVAYGAVKMFRYNARRKMGLSTVPLPIIIGQVALLAVASAVIVAVANADKNELRTRGVPVIALLMIVLMVVLMYVSESTRFGRYVLAVGGNKEAARRAGIRVERIRLYVFMLSSFMAGLGGLVLASRLQSVSANTGGGQLLLNAISAAVIGGTSLFGGRGKIYSALLGALVIAMVENGLVFLGVASSTQYVITGVVLLLAVIIDSISRRNQKRSGLA